MLEGGGYQPCQDSSDFHRKNQIHLISCVLKREDIRHSSVDNTHQTKAL